MRHFSEVRRVLKNDGHFYFLGNYVRGSELRIIKSLLESFPVVQEHEGENETMLIAGNTPLVFDPPHVDRVIRQNEGLRRCRSELGLTHADPNDDLGALVLQSLQTHNIEDYKEAAPIKEERADTEYTIAVTWDGVRRLFRLIFKS